MHFDSKIKNFIYDDFFLNNTFNTAEMISFSKKEVEWLTRFLDLETHSRILDVACGSGRHLKPFVDLGFSPVGVDSSSACVNLPKENFPTISSQIFQEDFLTFADSHSDKYNLVFIAGASFGYDPSAAVNLKHLQKLIDLVSIDGYLVIQYLNKNWASSRLKKEVTLWNENELYYILDSRKLDADLLNSSKIFIKKNDSFKKVYSDIITTYIDADIIKSVAELAATSGKVFEKINISDSFSDTDYNDLSSATPVLILKRVQ